MYQCPIPQCYLLSLGIVHFEMLNVLVAVRLWGSSWQYMKIKLFCDNKAVMNI